MVTTIQLNENVKKDLDGFRKGREAYWVIISGLMKTASDYKKCQE